MIPFLKPDIREEDIERMNESIRTGWLVPGKYSQEFEDKLKSYFKVKYAKLTNSCTMALEASLIMAGVGFEEDDEVITTPLSWVGTSNVILYLGAKPVFADVDDTGCINPDEILKKITPKTKAIIPVHLYGQLADMYRINKIAGEHGLKVIEDAAHSPIPGIGTGDYACLSFHAAKNLTSGQGGAILSNHPIDERLLYHGVEHIDGKRRMTSFGYKGEMTDFQAALLSGQIDRSEENTNKRLAVFMRYINGLVGKVKFPNCLERPSAYHLFVIYMKNRDEVRKKLEKICQTSIHYEAIYLEPFYDDYPHDCPIAERMGQEIISLPTYPDLTEEEQDLIIKTLCEKLY